MRIDIIKTNKWLKRNKHLKYVEMDFIPRKGDQISIDKSDDIYIVDTVNYWIVEKKLLSVRIWVV